MTLFRAHRMADCASPQENPHPDIGKYASVGHKQIIRKVSEGTGYHWFYGEYINRQAHDNGLIVGNYHWLRPDSDAVDQAHFFMDHLTDHAAHDWLMVDYEWPWDGVSDISPEHRANQLDAFTSEVHNALPAIPLGVYTNVNYCQGPMINAVAHHPVILASYSARLPVVPASWRMVAWQYSSHASVPGFPNPVDYNELLDLNWPNDVPRDRGEDMNEKQTEGMIINAMRALVHGGTHGPFGPANKQWTDAVGKLREDLTRLDKRERKS